MIEPDPYAELLLLCSEGDQHAFQRIYERTSGRMYGLCLRLMQSQALAEEVMQEGYVKIWNSASRFDPSRASAQTWMTTVIRNRALDVLRSQRARPDEVEADYECVEFAALEAGPLDTTSIHGSTQHVLECMEELEPKQRQAILMAYYYGHTHGEISEYLDSPLGTIKAWIRRGIQRLRLCLE